MRVNGKLCYLWRAVDHEGEVLEAVVTTKRDKPAALKLLKQHQEIRLTVQGRHRWVRSLFRCDEGDRLCPSTRGRSPPQQSGGELASTVSATRASNARFRSIKTLQKFSSVHAQVHNQFNQERHLVTRQRYKQRRSAALAEWRALAA